MRTFAAILASAVPALALGHTESSTHAPSKEGAAPRLIVESPAAYPAEAKQSGVEGVVVLALSLDAAGAVRSARVIGSLSPSFDEAALLAAEGLRFSPARLDGRAVPSSVRFSYRFVLPDAALPIAEIATASTASVAIAPVALGRYAVDVTTRAAPRSASEYVIPVDAIAVAPRAGAGAAELMRRAPGVVLSQHSGEGKAHQIFIRGFDAVHGQDVAIRAGGVPINEVSHVHAQGYANLHFLIPEVIRELRVIEGPYEASQGDFAVIGSVDFDLGLAHRGLLARVSAGQHGLVRGLLAWGPEGASDGTFVAAELTRGTGFGPARAHTQGSGIAQAELSLDDRSKLRLLVTTHAGRYGSAGVLRAEDLALGRVDFFDSYDPHQGGTSSRHQLLAEIRHDGETSHAELATHVGLKRSRIVQNFTGFTQHREGDRSEQLSDALTAGFDGHYTRRFSLFGRKQHASVGVELRHDRRDESQVRLRTVDDAPHHTDVDAELEITHAAMWAELELKLASFLGLRLGARADLLSFDIYEKIIDRRRDAGGIHFAPKATLTVAPLDALKLYASYGAGFRSPQALSLGQGESAPFTAVHAGELGLRVRLPGDTELSAAAFAVFVGEDLVFDHVTGRSLEAGHTRRLGGSLLAQSRPFEWLRGSISAALVSAVFTADEARVPYVPPVVVRLDLDARHPVGELWSQTVSIFGDLGVTALGPRPLPFSETADPVVTVEAGFGVEIGAVAMSVEAFNLLDARWRDGEFVYASNFDDPSGESAVPARHFTAGRPLSLQGTLTVKL